MRGISIEQLRDDKNISLIKDLYDEISDAYINQSPSDTLITKIMLGTFGCVPAFDRYFKKSIDDFKMGAKCFNIKTLKNIIEFYYSNKNEFEKLRNEMMEDETEYTPMRLIDIAFWESGSSQGNREDDIE